MAEYRKAGFVTSMRSASIACAFRDQFAYDSNVKKAGHLACLHLCNAISAILDRSDR